MQPILYLYIHFYKSTCTLGCLQLMAWHKGELVRIVGVNAMHWQTYNGCPDRAVKSYSDTVRNDTKFQQVKKKSRVVYGKSTKNTLRAAPEV